MLAEALLTSRDGTVLQHIEPMKTPAYPQRPVGDTASMHRWEAILRFNVALFDLLGGLEFVAHPDKNKPQRGKATLSCQGKTLLAMHRPEEAFFQRQFAKVAGYAEIRPDRLGEVVVQMQPQVPFWASVVHFHPSHSGKTLELIELALGFVSILCMRFKQAMAVARPIDWSTDIQPIIATPSHSAYPSGHATEAYMIAYTLPGLVTADPTREQAYREQLLLLAHRIAENRSVAGVHYPVDSLAGQCLAHVAASYFLWQCGKRETVQVEDLRPQDADMDFRPDTFVSEQVQARLKLPTGPRPLVWLAEQAAKEWV